MKLHVKIGAAKSTHWRDQKDIELKDVPNREVVTATWFEYSGQGRSQRQLTIPYADLDEVIELLSHIKASSVRRARQHAAMMKHERATLAAVTSLLPRQGA